MAIENTASRTSYLTDGQSTAFPTGFPLAEADGITVILEDMTTGDSQVLTRDADYVAHVLDNDGLVITMGPARPAGYRLHLLRTTAPVQRVQLPTAGAVPSRKLESTVDRQAMAVQERIRDLERAITGPIHETVPMAVPAARQRADRLLAFGAEGQTQVTDLTVTRLYAIADSVIVGTETADGWQWISDGESTDYQLPEAWAGMVSPLSLSVAADTQHVDYSDYTVGDGILRFPAPWQAGVVITGRNLLAGVGGLRDEVADLAAGIEENRAQTLEARDQAQAAKGGAETARDQAGAYAAAAQTARGGAETARDQAAAFALILSSGRIVHVVETTPGPELGQDGDMALLYGAYPYLFGPKAAGAWVHSVPLRGTGNVNGPATTVAGRLAVWLNEAGTQLGQFELVPATTTVAGLMSATDKAKLDGVASGATALVLASTNPAALGTSAPGSGTTAARADHVHPLPAAATTTVPGLMSATDKAKLDGVAASAAEARSSNAALTATDNGKTLLLSGTWTQTYAAGSSLPAGWRCRAICVSGTITHDPSGGELIGGTVTAVQKAGDIWDIMWDGGAYVLSRLAGRRMELLTSGTSWTPPAGVYQVLAEAVGGGGGMQVTGSGSGGGGAGGRCVDIVTCTPGVAVAMTVGAAGSTGATPTNGGTTTFGPLLANGGYAGSVTNVASGGTAAGGLINQRGGNGVPVDMGGTYKDGWGGVTGGPLSGLYGSGGGNQVTPAQAQQGAILLIY